MGQTLRTFTIWAEATDQYQGLLDQVVQNSSLLQVSGQEYKRDRAAVVYRKTIQGVDLVIKHYTARNAAHAAKRLLRRTRARNAWLASQRFLEAGIPVPSPVFCVEQRAGPFRCDSYFAYIAVDGDLLLDWLPLQESAEVERTAARMVALLARMKQNKLVHGDMKATNIMVADKGLVLFDLDAAGYGPLFYASRHRSDVRRFLRNWESHPAVMTAMRKALGQSCSG